MAGDKKTRLVEPERCISVTGHRRGCDALVPEAYGKPHRGGCDALVAEAYGKQAQGGCDTLVAEAYGKPHRGGCDALVAEAYGKQATQGRRGVTPTRKKKAAPSNRMELLKKLDRSERCLSASRAGGDTRASPTQFPPAPAAQTCSARARP